MTLNYDPQATREKKVNIEATIEEQRQRFMQDPSYPIFDVYPEKPAVYSSLLWPIKLSLDDDTITLPKGTSLPKIVSWRPTVTTKDSTVTFVLKLDNFNGSENYESEIDRKLNEYQNEITLRINNSTPKTIHDGNVIISIPVAEPVPERMIRAPALVNIIIGGFAATMILILLNAVGRNWSIIVYKARKPRCYVSYAWADKENPNRESKIDQLCVEAENSRGRSFPIEIIRDKDALRPGDQISKFMRGVGQGDLVFVFLSDKYIKSTYCMTELIEIWHFSDRSKVKFLDRIVIVAIENIDYKNISVRASYHEFWEYKSKNMKDDVSRLSPDMLPNVLTPEDLDELQRVRDIVNNISNILSALSDSVAYSGSFRDIYDLYLFKVRAWNKRRPFFAFVS